MTRAVAGLRPGRAARRGAGASATTSASSRPCAPRWPRARAGERQTDEELDHAIRQIVSRAVASDEVVDIFAAAGLKKPDISILSDEFLAEVRGMPHSEPGRGAAAQAAERRDQARAPRRNLVQARSFAEMLEQAHPALPEPRHRDRAGHRGADRAGQGDARGRRRGARSWG